MKVPFKSALTLGRKCGNISNSLGRIQSESALDAILDRWSEQVGPALRLIR
jgi:hypothetical protein